MKAITLGSTKVDQTSGPYVIAEIGVNHEGNLELAKTLIDQAKAGGAHAAKFQSYKAETISSRHSPSYWDLSKEPTTSQFELFKKYDAFGPKEYAELAAHCHKVGIDFLSTPFDDDAVDFLDPLMPFFKIASADLTNLPFLRKIAAKKKPVVLSTGASTLAEIDLALSTLRGAGCDDIVLLHCILNYPTPAANAHLRMISHLRHTYPDILIGYSDHTLPDATMRPLVSAFLLGAVVIEKHFTHDKSLPGNDHYHAMDERDCQVFLREVAKVQTLLGSSNLKMPIADEALSRKNARRSIVLKRSVKAGTPLTEADLTYKRPGTGISPADWDEVLGQACAIDLAEDHVLQWRDLRS